jgi:hypothetical protein
MERDDPRVIAVERVLSDALWERGTLEPGDPESPSVTEMALRVMEALPPISLTVKEVDGTLRQVARIQEDGDHFTLTLGHNHGR